MTQTIEVVETATTDVPDEASHIVHVPGTEKFGTTPQAYVLQARIEGRPVKALCGHEFIPVKDPAPLPVCEPCLAEYRNDPNGKGDRGDLPDA